MCKPTGIFRKQNTWQKQWEYLKLCRVPYRHDLENIEVLLLKQKDSILIQKTGKK